MELVDITIRFDSPKEQRFVERHVDLSIWNREVHPVGSGLSSWTEFDIDGCEPSDIHAIFDEVMAEWENHKYEEEDEEEDEE